MGPALPCIGAQWIKPTLPSSALHRARSPRRRLPSRCYSNLEDRDPPAEARSTENAPQPGSRGGFQFVSIQSGDFQHLRLTRHWGVPPTSAIRRKEALAFVDDAWL